MDSALQDSWFYSKGEERIGPVTLAELRVKAAGGELHPRNDLVWCAGMESWTPAGEVDGLFERKAAAAREAIAPTADPYRAPSIEAEMDAMFHEADWEGAGRRPYLVAILVFPLLWNFVMAFGNVFIKEALGPEIAGVAILGAAFVPLVVGIWYSLARLVNLGMSRWWFLGNLVPILNFWVGYRCFACPPGYAYHKKMDGIGIFLAIVYWLLMVLSLLVVALVVAVLVGALRDPELQKQIQGALQVKAG